MAMMAVIMGRVGVAMIVRMGMVVLAVIMDRMIVAVIVGVRMVMAGVVVAGVVMVMPLRRGRNEGLAADDPAGGHDDMPDRMGFLAIVIGGRRHMRMGMVVAVLMPVIVARMVVIVAMVLGGFWRRGVVTAGGGRLGRFGHDRGPCCCKRMGDCIMGQLYGEVLPARQAPV